MSHDLYERPRMLCLPRRQVHLDFHTSEHIGGIGEAFDEADFQEVLRLGRVNSITLFAKCHHSWSYYPTRIGRPHPGLATDLLGRQIAAAHAIGVRSPVYYPVGWSANDALEHPEWCARGPDGAILTCNADADARDEDERPIVSWVHLCPGSASYRTLILEQARELCERYEIDGFFFDICFNTAACHCDACQQGMAREGIDPRDEAAARAYAARKWIGFMRACNELIHTLRPDASVFYNGMAHPTTPAAALPYQTHLELEDLPTTWGGYDRFPLRARFFAGTGKTIVAMSGKFHTTWGEFGGFKSAEAMRAEVASMVAFGAACSFGDQLHPSGRMDPATYRNIGRAYAYAEQIEAYAAAATPISNLAIWPGVRADAAVEPAAMADDQGVSSMLLEGQYSFEVMADPASADLSRYQTIILTGSRCLADADIARLRRFMDEGGSVLAMHESILGPDGAAALDIGARYLGPARFKVDYTAARPPLAVLGMTSPVLNYTAGTRVACTDGLALAEIHEPFFDRTYGRYCSHQNAPHRPEPAEHVAAVRKGNLLYLAHPLGRQYHEHGAWLHRELFLRALRLVHRRPTVQTSMPSAGRVSLLHQPHEQRYALHLLYAPPLARGRCLVLEDQVPLTDVDVTVNLPHRVQRVHLPLRGLTLEPRLTEAGLTFRVPRVEMHEVVLLELAPALCGVT